MTIVRCVHRDPRELLEELRHLEEQYGVPTSQLESAFLTEDGKDIDETDDFHRWCTVRGLARRAGLMDGNH